MRFLVKVGIGVLGMAAWYGIDHHRYGAAAFVGSLILITTAEEVCYAINNIGRNQPQKYGIGSVK